jgi:hypothetical protein
MTTFARTLLLLACIALVALLAGCASKPAPTRSPVNAAAIVASQAGKDAVIISEAAKIDAIAPAAKPHTDAQRAAVAAAPAADVARIVAEFEAAAKTAEKTLAAQAAQIAALQDAELRAQVRTMRWFGFGCILAAVALGYARQIQFAIMAAGSGFLSLALAQLWSKVASHPAFMPTIGGVVVLGFVGFVWAAVHAYKKGDLAAKTEREAERLKDTLATMVPAIDDALGTVDTAAKQTIRATLSRLMDSDQKALVHEIRAALAK